MPFLKQMHRRVGTSIADRQSHAVSCVSVEDSSFLNRQTILRRDYLFFLLCILFIIVIGKRIDGFVVFSVYALHIALFSLNMFNVGYKTR